MTTNHSKLLEFMTLKRTFGRPGMRFISTCLNLFFQIFKSPTRYGIRGKIDLTLKMRQIQQVKFPTQVWHDSVSVFGNQPAFAYLQDLLMPLELKTGKSTFGADHKAQVSLHDMCLSS